MFRVGIGYDVHRLVEGRPLIIGGVHVPFDRGLLGHSDADVLLHAVTDALLGAAALGDIGTHFPDTDEQWRGADSLTLLAQSGKLISDAGFRVLNVDATVALQLPKLRPYIDEMRERIAEALGLDAGQVSVKASTTEKLGFVGTGDGAAAFAICALAAHTAEYPEGT
jgi:2-C-methyl-D-erythritol 2,4-cyclodiphosphate synthase